MNPEKRELYTKSWTQSYSMKSIQDMADELMDKVVEDMLEYSDFLEAKQVIARVKKG